MLFYKRSILLLDNITLELAKYRSIKNKLAAGLVTFGGWGALATLLLIFIYLAVVVIPLLDSAKVEQIQQFQLADKTASVYLAIEEQNDVAFRVLPSGRYEFFALQNSHASMGTILNQGSFADFGLVTPIRKTLANNTDTSQLVVVDGNNQAYFFDVDYLLTYQNGVRLVEGDVNAVFSTHQLQLNENVDNSLVGFSANASQTTLAAIEADTVNITRLYRKNLLAASQQQSRILETKFTLEDNFTAKQILIGQEQRRLYIASDTEIMVYSLAHFNQPNLLERFSVATDDKVDQVSLLSGGFSVITGHQSGAVKQWFQVDVDGERNYQFIRAFEGHNAGNQHLAPELYRKGMFVLNEDGILDIYFFTSELRVFSKKILDKPVQNFAVSIRANAVLAERKGKFYWFEVENHHPEVSIASLWQKVWYEGHDEPEYIWQSTSATDETEPKLSLVPIAFGTLKAAFYAMLFAIPVGLAAAIYTAYFMPAKLRTVVKPTIEFMEALPTVILGFLAGLWLAPLIENHLPGVIALLILLPISVFLMALCWHISPDWIKNKLPERYNSILLIAPIVLLGYLSFYYSQQVELWLFGGDARSYLTNELGLNFDQRNAMVVGIAMGFAVVPNIFSIAEDAIFSVPKHLSEGSLALGATQWQTLYRVVLLTASPGIFSAVMIGVGRAVGETMIVLMATGNTPVMDFSVFSGMRTLSANIAVEMPEAVVGSSHYRVLFLAALVLFIFTFFFNTVAEYVRHRLRAKYSIL